MPQLRRKSFCLPEKPAKVAAGAVHRRGSLTLEPTPPVRFDRDNRRGSLIQRWFKHISDAADAYKSREGKSRRCEMHTPEPEVDADLPAALPPAEVPDAKVELPAAAPASEEPAPEQPEVQSVSEDGDKRLSQADADDGNISTDGSGTIGGNSKREAHMHLATEDQPLIQPSEVTVKIPPVHIAHPVVTSIEQVRRKDEAIRQALAEKQALVAEILHVPPEDFHTIVDMAGDMSTEKEPTELVLAAINQANVLWSTISDSLNITEVDQVLSTSTQIATCSNFELKQTATLLPNSQRIQNIAGTLNVQLTALLKVVKDREDERERMRREVQKLREQIHVMHDAQLKTSSAECLETNFANDVSSGELENIEEDP